MSGLEKLPCKIHRRHHSSQGTPKTVMIHDFGPTAHGCCHDSVAEGSGTCVANGVKLSDNSWNRPNMSGVADAFRPLGRALILDCGRS